MLKPGPLLLCIGGLQSSLLLTEIARIPNTGLHSGLLIIISTIDSYLHLHTCYELGEQAIVNLFSGQDLSFFLACLRKIIDVWLPHLKAAMTNHCR